MDSLIASAARALATGDVLEALNRIALREDPPALALRGVAMAQLGEYPRARELLRRAARAFGAHEPRARARCIVAEAEVALALRDLAQDPRRLAAALAELEARADLANAAHARLILVRRQLLLGRLETAAALLHPLAGQPLPPALAAVAAMAGAEIAARRLACASARAALAQARSAASRAAIPALIAEVDEACTALDRPAARRVRGAEAQALRLDRIEALVASGALVIDACRRGVRAGGTWIPLARRPVLFALARMLAEGWPREVDRNALIAGVFRMRAPDESHRARLRVEIGRLRRLIAPLAAVEARGNGFALVPRGAAEVVVLAPPLDGEGGSLLALLGDGAAWSTSALALALDTSQRTVQRTLSELEAAGQVRSLGRARARRWLAPPLAGFTTILLLPTTLPSA